ncbi:MAG: CoB--CoM heterodisulfide reductase iron-sulfur subunit B family protein [Proteobacteria bacterium]|nr:CoB--CoM heterodisulfide reductase iron-sulfur subunit B family protein [Pseudomonadota bacterium]
MKFAFFPGCFIPARYPGFEVATREVFRRLDVELVDLDFSCCPPTTNVKLVNYDTWLTMAARNLSLAQEHDLNIVSMCNGCTSTLKEAAQVLANKPGQRRKVNLILKDIGRRYDGRVSVTHISPLIKRDIGVEAIRERVVRPLKGLRIAAHYGCHYFRPPRVMFPESLSPADSYVPIALDKIVEVLGGEAVQYSRKFLCCGSVLGTNIGGDETYGVVWEKLEHLNYREVEAIVVPCGSCFNQFEMGQVMAKRLLKIKYNIPVFYFTELIALAFGVDPATFGITEHNIKTRKILDKIL